MNRNVIFTEDVVALGDVKVNPGRIVQQVDKTHRPVLVTSRGHGVAVIQSVHDYEAKNEEREFLRGIVKGLIDLEQGREVDLETVKKRFNIK